VKTVGIFPAAVHAEEVPASLLAVYSDVWQGLLMDYKALEDKAQSAADFLKMMASAPRLLLMCLVLDNERSVGELAEKTGMRMPTVSQQLALLRAQGLVTTRREGTTIYYQLASEPVRDIMSVLYKNFCADAELPGPKQLEPLDAD
jgi:DNA-binding transcriptional ArsR family regulator